MGLTMMTNKNNLEKFFEAQWEREEKIIGAETAVGEIENTAKKIDGWPHDLARQIDRLIKSNDKEDNYQATIVLKELVGYGERILKLALHHDFQQRLDPKHSPSRITEDEINSLKKNIDFLKAIIKEI